jgi:O-antigen ligase
MRLSPVSLALCATALAAPVSIAAANVALGLLAAALLWRLRTGAKLMTDAWRQEPALAALVLYGLAGLVAGAFSGAPAASLRDALKDWHRLWSLGLFVAALALEPEAPLGAALGVSFSAMAAVGLWQAARGIALHGTFRAHAFVHPVVFGEQMAVAVLGGLCALLRPTGKRTAEVLFAALVLAALIMSQTRMALFASAAGFALIALLEPRARRWAVPAFLSVAVVAGAWELLPGNSRTLSAVFSPAHNDQQTRWVLWDVALRMFRDHAITGAGPGGYGRLFSQYHPGLLESETGWGSAHNLYLHQLAERGVIGAVALLVLCGTLLARAVRAARADADARALWAAGAVAVLLTMSLTETAFQNEQFAVLFLLIWARGTARLRRYPTC